VKTIAVRIIGDTVSEADETFFLRLSAPTNATITDGEGVGTIMNDDGSTPPPPPPTPSLSISPVSITEGDSGTKDAVFTVSLSAVSSTPVTVNYGTTPGTALAGSDFVATSGTLTFAPGETTKTIRVPVVGDTVVEATETFGVALSGPVGAILGTASATGTILDNDVAAPSSAVRYVIRDNWGSGFVADVTITNTGTTAINGWTLEFDAPFTITNIWNGKATRSGSRHTIRNESWNGTILPGQSITLGFQATPGGSSTGITNVRLNGQPV
jgi:chitinase